MRVVVVFSEQNRIKWLKFLKPGTGIDGLDSLAQFLVFDVQVDFGGKLAIVAQEFLSYPYVVAFSHYPSSKSVAQHVGMHHAIGVFLDAFPDHYPT